MTTRYPLYLKTGDDETRVFKYLDSTGVVVNLTGYTANGIFTVGATTITVTATVDGPNGKVTVTLTDAQTHTLGTVGNVGFYEIKVHSASAFDTTIATGPLLMTTPKD